MIHLPLFVEMRERSIQVTYLFDKRGTLNEDIFPEVHVLSQEISCTCTCTSRGFRFNFFPRDQENIYTEKMQNLQQTLVEERDKILQNANQQRSMLEESLNSTKTEEQRLRTKLAEAEEVGVLACFACSLFSLTMYKKLRKQYKNN